MKTVEIGASKTKTVTVTEDQVAKSEGSGTVSVFATPMMVALMEGAAAACLVDFLDEGETSVGMQISTSHLAATPLGMTVSATATITAVDGKKVSFSIEASDEKDLIGKAQHDRFVVVQEKFESRANAKNN